MAAGDRFYRWKVTTSFPFPVDMLRYDRCFPSDSETANAIEQSHSFDPVEGKVTYNIEGSSRFGPTVSRWDSVSCNVHSIEESM